MQRRHAISSFVTALFSTSALAQPPADPARFLEAILSLVAQGNLSLALRKSGELVARFPNYRPAQIIFADLLALHSGRASEIWRSELLQSLHGTHSELGLRLKAHQSRPLINQVPAEVVFLGSHTRKLIAIDTTKARLYAVEHENAKTSVVADYYVSVGRLGVGKRIEGDEKTPHGIYSITKRMGKKELHDPFFGSGALPINYPNPFDRKMGRTGFGIWLHGSPPNEPSRALFSTNGCIVLANSDMKDLLDWAAPYRTPVVISKNLHWQALPRKASPASNLCMSQMAWNEAGHSARINFDVETRHRFERDMVRYETSQNGAWLPLQRNGSVRAG